MHSPKYSANEEPGAGLVHSANEEQGVGLVPALGVSAHQTPDLARCAG
jgi:hypothetical protein